MWCCPDKRVPCFADEMRDEDRRRVLGEIG
jgi:hypothetical protein